MKRLPESLIQQLEAEADRVGARPLNQAAERLSEAYRKGEEFRFRTEEDCLAYAVSRMPATFGAICQALAGLTPKPHSLLDIGAGPGTAAWACAQLFGGLQNATLIERDSGLAALGRKLNTPCTRWVVRDLRDVDPLTPQDLVVMGYSLGEFALREQAGAVDRAWAAARQTLLLVEPGTPAGFERIRSARERLIAAGAQIRAPCPHLHPCPIKAPDWCHFASRIERTRLHRIAKQGTLGYEDEKFSYLIASKCDTSQVPARVLRHPQIHKGLIELRLCSADGLQAASVRKKDALWRAARKARWGDPWPRHDTGENPDPAD
jgi:ribosomal protein RSM22 (predicted rRNA methylase)